MSKFKLQINGEPRTVDAAGDTPLLWIFRDHFGLTGTKYGCGEGICGACSILEGDDVLRSCQLTIAEATGRSFVTIEGLSPDGNHPVQRAWIEEDVSQCGYCQAGMMMTAVSLLKSKPRPSDADINDALSTSLCRCGTYQRVRRAIHRAAGDGA